MKRDGPKFELCKRMNPGFSVNRIQINKFTSHEQCGWHKDTGNVGTSRIAFLGKFTGGGLELADGRVFDQKYLWYDYAGSCIDHRVMPFCIPPGGGRLSVILYTLDESKPTKSQQLLQRRRDRGTIGDDHARTRTDSSPVVESLTLFQNV